MIALFQDHASNLDSNSSDQLLYRNNMKGCHAPAALAVMQFALIPTASSWA